MKLIINRIKILSSNKEYILGNTLELPYKDTNDLLELLLKKNPESFEIEYVIKDELVDKPFQIQIIGGNDGVKNYIYFLKNVLGLSISFSELRSHIQILTQDKKNSLDKLLNLNVFVQNILTSNEDNQSQNEIEKIKAKLNENDKNKLPRFIEISIKIKNLEKDINIFQKNKDNKELNDRLLKDKEKNLEILKQKISSTTELVKNKSQLEARYNKALGSTDIEKLKLERFNQTINTLENVKKEQIMNVYREEDKVEFKLKYKILIVFIVLEILIGTYLTIISSSLTTLLASITLFIAMVFVYITLQIVNYKNTNKLKKQNIIKNNVTNPINSNNNLDLEAFKNNAINNAIKLELEKVDTLINNQLGGKSLESINKDIKSIEKEIVILKEFSEKNLTSQDELYKKRRELDILRIEKENIENSTSLKGVVSDEVLSILEESNQKSEVNNNEVSIPLFVVQFNHQFDEMIEKYKNIRQVILINEVT